MTWHMRSMQFALVVAAAVGVACGGAADTPRTEEISADETPVRACSLLTESEWTEVLGTKEAEPNEENLRVTSGVPNRFKSSCLLAGEKGWAYIFVERPYVTRAGSSEDLAATLRTYQEEPARRRDSRLYPELAGKTIAPYDGLDMPAVTLTPSNPDLQSAILVVRQTGITTGIRVEADTLDDARRIMQSAMRRLP